MNEENNIIFSDAEETEVQYKNPTAGKVMKWVDFALQLCRLLKSILSKIFLWLEKWESDIEKRNTVS